MSVAPQFVCRPDIMPDVTKKNAVEEKCNETERNVSGDQSYNRSKFA
jgi:hypothetical protein